MPTYTRAHSKNLYAWGDNSFGQIGLETLKRHSLPQKVNLGNILPCQVKQICGGVNVTLLLTDEGKVYGCGLNTIFQLGTDDSKNCTFSIVPTDDYFVEQIALLQSSCFALTNSGKIIGWGSNSHGQLATDPFKIVSSKRPIELFGSEETYPVQIAAGSRHCVVLTRHGDVYACGDGKCGQLGKPREFFQSDFTLVENLKHVRHVVCGQHNNLARTKDKKLFAWGWNSHGQCGSEPDKGIESQVALIEIVLPVPIDAKFKIACGWRHSAVLLGNGDLYIWGDNQAGQLGQEPNVRHVSTPTKVLELSELVQDVAIGSGHTLVLLKTGEMIAWGENEFGTCGIGNFEKKVLFPLKTRVGFADVPLKIFSGCRQCFVLAG